MSEQIEHIALVGHCGFDEFMLRRAIKSLVGERSVQAISRQEALTDFLNAHSLLLINRKLDGLFQTDSGIELIRRLADADTPPVMMLVSDIDAAQTEAQAAGAMPGFGKSQLNQPETARRVEAALSPANHHP